MVYFEKDNHGTRQDTVGKADAYWMNRNFGTGKTEPFLLYAFKTGDEAKNALTGIDFIHVATDTGNLICLKICHFGFYVTNAGHWEAIIAGQDMTLADFNNIKTIFINNNGSVINQRASENDQSLQTIKPVDLSTVIFKEIYQKPLPENIGPGHFTYEVYEGPDKNTAIKFLEEQLVKNPLYYVRVETPEGIFAKDNVGIYDA